MNRFPRLNWPLGALVGVGSASLIALTLRVHDWVVMTDELQYSKLATHIGISRATRVTSEDRFSMRW